MTASCRCSCALRIIGFATALHSRSATIVDARSRSCSLGPFRASSHGKMSRSSSSVSTRQTLERFSSRSSAFIRAASSPFSMRPTRDLLAPESPTSRSTASGGAVHMRSVGSAFGFAFSVRASRLRKSRVERRATFTCSVVFTRVARNAAGANSMNHRLNWSIEAAMSAFHRCGLSALMRSGDIVPFRLLRRDDSRGRCRMAVLYGKC